MPNRRHAFLLANAAALLMAAPALAQPMPPAGGVVDAAGRVYGNAAMDPRPEWKGGPTALPGQPMPVPAMPAAPMGAYGQAQPYGGGYDAAAFERAREGWLIDCRRNHGNGNMVGGAVVGGLIGGLIGNEVAGRGNRTLGTVAGATVGAVAGGAIGHGADKRSRRDWCEAYLDSHMTYATTWGPAPAGYTGPSYSYAMQPVTMMVPVMMVQQAAVSREKKVCKETVVTEEWVTVRSTRRYVPRPAPVIHDKRVRIVPDKRVRIN